MSVTHTIQTSIQPPKHIAFMMDGNGRWATNRGLPRTAGHFAGMNTMRDIIRTCHDIGLEYLTLYAFSSENWKRPQEEVNYILDLPFMFFDEETLAELNDKNIQVKLIGDPSKLNTKLQAFLNSVMEKTSSNTGMVVNFAINYGGRMDILNAVKKIISEGTDEHDISEELIDKYLYTEGQPSPDLVIRTSGEIRLSNFLLWQSSNAELWFTDTLWPDFNKTLLLDAINDYTKRKQESKE